MTTNTMNFWDRYELINSSHDYSISPKKKEICRFCLKNSTQTTFAQKTHLIPELLGKNDTLTYDECDQCNKRFSGFESHLSNFVRPYITFLGVKGKKKIPIFQSRTENGDEKTRAFLKHDGNHKRIFQVESLNDLTIHPDNNVIDFIFRKPSYIPLKVYKSILKIGLSLLPNELLASNRESFDWLLNRGSVHFIPYVYMTGLNKKSFLKPTADLFRAKSMRIGDHIFPECTLVLCFANQIIQLFLPFSLEFKEIYRANSTPTLELFPAFAFDTETREQMQIKVYDLRSTSSYQENLKLSIKYDGNIPAPNKLI